MDNKKPSRFERFKNSWFYRSINTVASSAIIGLALTLIFFAYKVYFGKKQFDETVNRLDNISRSLSTRCLGKFPAYISEINDVFSTLQTGDTVIIFEDVLYYGIKSEPVGFSHLQQLLLNHARQGGKVIVAYYDNHYQDADFPWQPVFHRMILESRIASKYIPQITTDRYELMKESMKNHVRTDSINPQGKTERRMMMASIDSIVTEKYFSLTRDNDLDAAQKVVNGYMSFLDALNNDESSSIMYDAIVKKLCCDLDSIMHHYFGENGGTKTKKIKDIHFADYKNMYSDITDCIAEYYRYHGIELIPLNEYLTMSCWLIKPANKKHSVKSILAFPSKYTSDEIGFYSQDELFAEYITTILNGVRGNINEDKERPSNF